MPMNTDLIRVHRLSVVHGLHLIGNLGFDEFREQR